MIQERSFGKARSGEGIKLYTLENTNGIKAEIMNYGAILVNLFVPNQKGELADVVLGYDKVEAYFDNPNYFGATVGPIANRTANANFELDGVMYQLDKNDGENNLHTNHDKGLHKRIYSVSTDEEANSVTFTTTMNDGELGVPGNREFSITYALTADDALEIDYKGTTDKKTVMNLTNHSYFNLKGHNQGNIENEKLWLKADGFTEVVEGAIPTGAIIDVKGTPFDFTSLTVIGDHIQDDDEQLKIGKGYDHNFVSGIESGTLSKVAMVVDEAAGRTMEVYTDLPGVQFYTGNNIGEHTGKGGAVYNARSGLALETQHYPNSINEKSFPQPIVTPDMPYEATTVYKFL